LSTKVNFLTFFWMFSEHKGWTVPDVHLEAVNWLEHRGNIAVFRCFRGFGKSTILDIYNAWRYYEDPTYRILLQSESDGTAYKSSRDVQNILQSHPLTRDMVITGGIEQWWVAGSTDARNANMYVKGILSNVTSARADECQNDDVEVPRNIQTPEAREKLRYRLGEQTHILVPGGRQLYIGTPHTHDSLYDEQEKMGADCLTIRMFEQAFRIEEASDAAYDIPFIPEYVFQGIGKQSKVLHEGFNYQIKGNRLIFASAPGALVDLYAGCAWPERFDHDELAIRRKKTRTINEWDSQYQLHSKPVHDIRLDPDRIHMYDVEPVITRANKSVHMILGTATIVGASCRWDCSLGKIGGDASPISLILTDARGNLYWHFAEALMGDVDSQCKRVRELVIQYNIPSVVVETNGVGGFVPPILRKHLAGTQSAVIEDHVTGNKQKAILDGLEAPISGGFLWAHRRVLDGPVYDEMKDFNPAVTNQADDHIDSGARAITRTPIRIGQIVGDIVDLKQELWRPNATQYEVITED